MKTLSGAFRRSKKKERKLLDDCRCYVASNAMCWRDNLAVCVLELIDLDAAVYIELLHRVFGEHFLKDTFRDYKKVVRFFDEISLTLSFPSYSVEEYLAAYGEEDLFTLISNWGYDVNDRDELETFVGEMSFVRLAFQGEGFSEALCNRIVQVPDSDEVTITGKIINEEERYVEIAFSVFPEDQDGYRYGYTCNEDVWFLFLFLDYEELHRYCKTYGRRRKDERFS